MIRATMTISSLTAPAGMLVFTFTMVYAGLTDLMTMKIQNSLLLLFLLAYVMLAPLVGFTISEMGWSAAVAAAVLLVAFIFFALGWIGGGDAKFAAVTALWFGADHTAAYLIYIALLGGAFTLCLLQFRMMVLPAWLHARPWLARLHSQGCGVPYGFTMALAALIVFPHTRWMTAIF
jgi:prepilin peptidase CpaA